MGDIVLGIALGGDEGRARVTVRGRDCVHG
jgi:hypothetical protein